MDAIDLVETEVSEMHQMFTRNKPYKASNPLLLGKTPYKYMLHIMRQITANDMEQSLMILPFHYVKRFIAILQEVSCSH